MLTWWQRGQEGRAQRCPSRRVVVYVTTARACACFSTTRSQSHDGKSCPLHPRAQLPWVLLPDLAQREAAWAKHSEALLGGRTTLHLTGGAEVTVTHRPLALEARVGGKPALKFNAEGLLQYEHRRLTRVSASARRRPYLSTSCRGNGCILAWQVDACTLLARRTTGVFSNVAFSYSCGTASTSRGVAKSLTTFMPPYRRRVTAMVCSRRPSARTQTRSRRDRRA